MTKIAFLYDELNPSVRLCGYEQLRFLEDQKEVSVTFIKFKELTRAHCKEHDIFFFIRNTSAFSCRIAHFLHYNKKFIIYILDDDLLEIPKNLASSNYYNQDHIKNRIYSMLKICDIFLSPSIELLKKYQSITNRTIRIEEPALFYNMKTSHKKQSETIHIGFAGSIDRTSDVNTILTDVIIALKKKYQEKISFDIMGIEPNSRLDSYCNYYEYQEDYTSYQNCMQKLDLTIGLAPMPKTEFHSCKHYNKYIEYGALGIIGIYSNVIPYRKVIHNYKNGILCENTFDSWFSSISYLIEHPELYIDLQKNISRDMKENYELSVVSYQLLDSIPELTTYFSSKNVIYPFKFIKFISFLEQVKDTILFHKWKIFSRIFEKFIFR